MKIPVGKIATWLGKVIAAAAVQALAERLSRPEPVNDRRSQSGEEQANHTDRLERT